MSKDDSTFLGRWSRRKLEPEAEVEPAIDEVPDPDDDLSDEKILERLELPDPETLKDGDDFAAFMNKAVPDHLRKRALRKLWLSNPALANLDGLVEYGEDYTDAAMVPEVLNTAYKVGRGFLQDILEEKPDDDADETRQEATQVADIAVEEAPDSVELLADDPEGVQVAELEAPKHTPRPRMVFTTS